MLFNVSEVANVVASYLQSMFVEKKDQAIDHSSGLFLTLEQLAAEAICEDLLRRKLVGIGREELKDQLKKEVFNILDLMYITDNEKYRSVAVRQGIEFEFLVTKAVVDNLRRKWTRDDVSSL